MSLTQVTSGGLEHGLINTLGNSVKEDNMSRFAEKDRPAMEKLKKEQLRMVKAQYLHKDGGQERLEKPYMQWAGQPIQMWRFLHGHTYEVPKGLVDEVNDPNKRTKKRSGLLDKNEKPLETDQFDELMHRFVPVGF